MSRSNPVPHSEKEPRQPELGLDNDHDSKTQITTTKPHEFFEVCAREKRGEIIIHSLVVLNPNGKYRFHTTTIKII
ncbi:MAG: hypothetical protein KGL39_45710 [Patescibacteria group bacterium]|nr:hypothetical protein [Patescibacteria group bacterium]